MLNHIEEDNQLRFSLNVVGQISEPWPGFVIWSLTPVLLSLDCSKSSLKRTPDEA